MSTCSRFFLLIALGFSAFAALGQAARSPFSSYGLGEQYGTAMAPGQGMGGVGISNPSFLYLSQRHKEALSYLAYGIKERVGFIEITGEVGTGKTTVCRALLNQLDERTKTAFIFNSS